MYFRTLVPFGLLLLAGCSQTASPTFDDGSYYMTGDPTCVNYMVNPKAKRIMCHNSKWQPTGYRSAMTNQQIQMYQYKQMMQAQQNANMSAQIAANTAAMNAQTQANLARTNSNNSYHVTPLYRPGGGQVRCISTGFYTNCRAY